MIAILDFGAGNLNSVKYALNKIGHESVITKNTADIKKAERIIFPGVGAAKKAMENLYLSELDKALVYAYNAQKPILGICIGMQLVFNFTEENNGTKCIGFLKGKVKKFNFQKNKNDAKIPHMGWNQLHIKKKHPVLQGITQNSNFYFVHSYYAAPDTDDNIYGLTTYNDFTFTSVAGKDNLIVMQFHPEKSGKHGLHLLENFIKWDGKLDAH